MISSPAMYVEPVGVDRNLTPSSTMRGDTLSTSGLTRWFSLGGTGGMRRSASAQSLPASSSMTPPTTASGPMLTPSSSLSSGPTR